jgi:large subunit ribosomal protein L32
MAVPKRKTSKARRDKRRTHWKLALPTLGQCSHCGSVIESHHVCNTCGYYNGVEVFKPKEA